MPIRLRLTLWYLLILTIVLIAVAAGVYGFVATEERQSVDRILRERAQSFVSAYAGEIKEEPEAKAFQEVGQNYSEDDVLIYARAGQIVWRSPPRLLRVADFRSIPDVRSAIDRAFGGREQHTSFADIRVIAAPIPGARFVFVSTESLAGRRGALLRLRNAFLIVIPLAIVIAAIGGYFLAMRSLAPVAQMASAASRIEAENLSERISVRNPSDELGRLAAVLNALLERLERSFQQQKQLLADTSHELRTPVTIIRSEADVTLSRERTVDDYRRALETIRSEATHLTGLIEAVLLLARADAQQLRIAHQPLNLGDVVRETVQSLRTIADRRGIDLKCAVDGPMPMEGDTGLIRRMLLNLLDNAIKFTEGGGRVSLDAHRAGPQYVIKVSDSGVGVPREAQEHIFDRFFRVDSARGRDRDTASGAGLGLAIARWIAHAHGGDLRLLQSTSSGSVFEATLPASVSELAA
jgi:heavy metal sensor kinase